MITGNIVKFLASSAYSDESLAALLAHAQDGKLAYSSCCCFIGVSTANHSLRGNMSQIAAALQVHYGDARELPYALKAESEFCLLGKNDEERREAIIPLIIAEQERREQLRMEDIEAEAETNSVVGRDPVYDANGRY